MLAKRESTKNHDFGRYQRTRDPLIFSKSATDKKDLGFANSINKFDRKTREPFVLIVTNFLGNKSFVF